LRLGRSRPHLLEGVGVFVLRTQPLFEVEVGGLARIGVGIFNTEGFAQLRTKRRAVAEWERYADVAAFREDGSGIYGPAVLVDDGRGHGRFNSVSKPDDAELYGQSMAWPRSLIRGRGWANPEQSPTRD